MSRISASANLRGVTVAVDLQSLSAIKLAEEIEKGKLINFDVKARMEEKTRRSGWVRVGFALHVSTKPNVVKFEVEGLASLDGQDEEIRKMLEADPETNIPAVFSHVYQHAFMSMYLLATLIQAPYPPLNLLKSGQGSPDFQMESKSAEEADDSRPEDSKALEDGEELVQANISLPDEEQISSGVEVATATTESPEQL